METNRNLLNKTKVYTIGSMEYANGEAWRKHVTQCFSPLGITVLDPYNKQFVQKIDEGEKQRKYLMYLRQNEKYGQLAKFCKEFRIFDLACVDKCDFVVWNLDIKVPTIGSVEEFAWAVRLKKPAYVVCEQGKKKCPLWIFGMIPENYIFDTMNDFIREIYLLDQGERSFDDRWKLFNLDIR